jgi:hypothetical protein
MADESAQALRDAGANHVASLLVESRDYLAGLLEQPRVSDPEVADIETRATA